MQAYQEHSSEQKSEPKTTDSSSHHSKQGLIDSSPKSMEFAQLRKIADSYVDKKFTIQKKNDTGLPDRLKSGIEQLSGYSMDDVKVHFNSKKPAQLQAHAYAQGNQIHIAPGQEKHLPHEAWHVVQQKQGRVKPTKQLKSKVNINDDKQLEKEADVMGIKASNIQLQSTFIEAQNSVESNRRNASSEVESQKNNATSLLRSSDKTNDGENEISLQDLVNSYMDKKQSIQRKLNPIDGKNSKAQVIQLIVQGPVRKGYHIGKYYSSYDTDETRRRYYVKKENAEIRDNELRKIRRTEDSKKKEEDRTKKKEERRKKYLEKFGTPKFPESSEVIIMTLAGEKKKSAFTKLDSKNIKSFFENAIIARKQESFEEQLILFGGKYFILYPGPDIGVVPALFIKDGVFMREGNAETYSALSKGLDMIVKKYSKEMGGVKEARIRIGKDIMRATRSNLPSGKIKYTEEEYNKLLELASVLRLDKGRVPLATKYIKDVITKGTYSFKKLLVDNEYVGAGRGGVAELRKQAFEGGDESEGSDIEEDDTTQRRGSNSTEDQLYSMELKPHDDDPSQPRRFKRKAHTQEDEVSVEYNPDEDGGPKRTKLNDPRDPDAK